MPSILHLIPTLHGGGAERQLAVLASEQAARGWSAHVAFRRGGSHVARLGKAESHQLDDLRGPHPVLIAQVRGLMNRLRPDIVQTWLPQMDLVGGLATLGSGVPWILGERVAARGFDHSRALSTFRRLLARRADAIVSNSVKGAALWHDVARRPAPYVVDNAVDVEAIAAAPARHLEPWRAERVILCIGRLSEQKGHSVLLKAMSLIRDRSASKLAIVGEGELRDAIGREISARGLDDRVQMLPYIVDWWGLLKTVDVVVSMSRYEGQPNVVLEAMAGRCPVIVSDIPEHRAILDDESAVFVPLDDPEELARALIGHDRGAADTQRRVERAFDHVSKFTPAKAASAFELVYDDVLGRKS